VFVRDDLTTSGTNIATTNVTPSAGDEYSAFTVAFAVTPPPSGSNTTAFFAMF
jgi:hypothetical protein